MGDRNILPQTPADRVGNRLTLAIAGSYLESVGTIFTGNRSRGSPGLPWNAKPRIETASPALRYFGDRLQIPWLYQITLQGKEDVLDGPVRVLPAAKFLAALP